MIRKSGLSWYHIQDTDKDNYVAKFSVTGYPAKIIVDPNRKIIARYVGEDDEIYKKLDKLLR